MDATHRVPQAPLRLRAKGLRLTYWPTWVAAATADAWFARLRAETPWSQERIRMFGRESPVPRLVAWFADPGCHYSYSGISHRAAPWTPLLREIKAGVEQRVGTRFNSVLLNYYRTGQDSMGWHADDERELGKAPVIASVSLGATRTLQLKHRSAVDVERVSLDLLHGSLLVMHPPTQAQWLHQIPKRKRVAPPTERINLTFRFVVGNGVALG
jgi:alkylated DNA repair dioxygenase AlkB